MRRLVAINTLFFADYRWHFWARIWRTPILGELSMLAMNRPMFAQELRRGSKRISEAHIDHTWALMTPRMKKEVLRLYRAADPANFKRWESEFLALTRTKPTLVIWGDKDPYISPRFAERFNARKSCIFRTPVTGRRSKRQPNAPTPFGISLPNPAEASCGGHPWTLNSSASFLRRSAR